MYSPIPVGLEWPDLQKGWPIDITDDREGSSLTDLRLSAEIDHARFPDLTVLIGMGAGMLPRVNLLLVFLTEEALRRWIRG